MIGSDNRRRVAQQDLGLWPGPCSQTGIGRFGSFPGGSNWPGCGYTQILKPNGSRTPNFDQLPSDRRASVASESPRLVMSVLADLKSNLPGTMSPWRAPQPGSGMFGLGLGGRYTREDVAPQGSVGVSGVGQNAMPKLSGREANNAHAIQYTTLSHWGKPPSAQNIDEGGNSATRSAPAAASWGTQTVTP